MIARPLQNRVTPFGDIVAMSARGSMMGNRGGRLHDDFKNLGPRRWASKRWICCELTFKERRREVMGRGYTELFFLDEVTALAAGHRPCFECRRGAALEFQAAFPINAAKAEAMDRLLHAERLDRYELRSATGLPDGATWAIGQDAFARRNRAVFKWSAEGWLPVMEDHADPVRLLTPPSIVAALGRGYRPRWHGSAETASRNPAG